MAEAKTEQEPSIEEILESIRQIISDDKPADTTGGGALKGPAPEEPVKMAAAPPLPPPPPPAVDAGTPVLELTEAVTPPPAPASSPAPVSAPLPQIEMSDVPQDADGGLMSSATENFTEQALTRLMGSVPIERDIPDRMPVHGNVTLEDITRDLLRPMLKDWLDRNLPGMVEKLVQKEIEKITRRVLNG